MIKFEADVECSACKGTGIYVGCGEHDGMGVVCTICKGTGKVHIKQEFKEFTGKKIRNDVKHVIKVNPGIVTGNTVYKFEDFGGISYEMWFNNGGKFPEKSEMRKFVCPRWWYQCVDCHKMPQWKECNWGVFSNCEYFNEKEKCWARFDEENKQEGVSSKRAPISQPPQTTACRCV